jgi:heme oxygenase
VLAELAIANAAFQVIKQTLANGRDLLDAGDAVGKYFKAENDIAKVVEAKGKNNVLEMYQAQVQLRKNEENLKWLLNKQGLNGYLNFLNFKADYAREQKELAKLAARKKYARQKAIEENLTHAVKAFGILFVIMAAAFGVAVYWKGWP